MATDITEVQALKKKTWITGEIDTPVGIVPQVATRLDAADRWGAVKVRIGLGRMHYEVKPGYTLSAHRPPNHLSSSRPTTNYRSTTCALNWQGLTAG